MRVMWLGGLIVATGACRPAEARSPGPLGEPNTIEVHQSPDGQAFYIEVGCGDRYRYRATFQEGLAILRNVPAASCSVALASERTGIRRWSFDGSVDQRCYADPTIFYCLPVAPPIPKPVQEPRLLYGRIEVVQPTDLGAIGVEVRCGIGFRVRSRFEGTRAVVEGVPEEPCSLQLKGPGGAGPWPFEGGFDQRCEVEGSLLWCRPMSKTSQKDAPSGLLP